MFFQLPGNTVVQTGTKLMTHLRGYADILAVTSPTLGSIENFSFFMWDAVFLPKYLPVDVQLAKWKIVAFHGFVSLSCVPRYITLLCLEILGRGVLIQFPSNTFSKLRWSWTRRLYFLVRGKPTYVNKTSSSVIFSSQNVQKTGFDNNCLKT